jgi:putative glutamine transport system permease protein
MTDIFQVSIFLFLLQGLKITLEIAFASIVGSLVLGTALAVLRHRGGWPARLSAVYIEAVRNTPLLLFILAFRFMTPLPPVYAGIVAMTVFETATLAEIVRGGLKSIPKGQWEAARTQGFSALQALRYIVLPQALRNVIPPLISQFTTIIKDTSFVWAVGIEDLTGKGMIVMGRYTTAAQVFTLFVVIAMLYFLLNYSISCYARWRQAKMV